MTRQVRIAMALLCFCALAASGCAGMHADARKMLQEPVSCEYAQHDIRVLEASRPHADKRVIQGLQGIMPPLLVISLLRDGLSGEPYRSIYLDHWRVAFGSYNRKINARVEELEACGRSLR